MSYNPAIMPEPHDTTAPQNSQTEDRILRTFGRRLGRPLKGQRKNALEKLAAIGIPPDLLSDDIDTQGPRAWPGGPKAEKMDLRHKAEGPKKTIDPRSLFHSAVEKIWFEIGFGSGEHLLARLQQSPKDGFIGAEPYVNGMAMFLKNLPTADEPRVRVHMDDALPILLRLQNNSLDGLYILNPDPWPKKRHHKRRIINSENLNLFARVLKPGAALIFSTDVAELAEWTNDLIKTRQDFEITRESDAAPHTPPENWPLTTRYMAWGMSEGRKPHFLVYKRK